MSVMKSAANAEQLHNYFMENITMQMGKLSKKFSSVGGPNT